MVSKEIINNVIHLAQQRAASDRAFYEKYYPDGHMDLFDDRFNGTIEFEEKEKDDKNLDEYFHILPYDDIKDLQTLMYIGRGDFGDEEPEVDLFTDMRKYLDSRGWNKDKWVEENQMSEKIVLGDYLIKAKEFLGI